MSHGLIIYCRIDIEFYKFLGNFKSSLCKWVISGVFLGIYNLKNVEMLVSVQLTVSIFGGTVISNSQSLPFMNITMYCCRAILFYESTFRKDFKKTGKETISTSKLFYL